MEVKGLKWSFMFKKRKKKREISIEAQIEYLELDLCGFWLAHHSPNIKCSLPGINAHQQVMHCFCYHCNHQDSQKAKEVPKATKLLTRLFPNKVTIHMPQDENLLASWKQHLDRDAETLKMNGNLNNLRNVLNRTGLECDGLETLCIKDQLLTNEGAEKIVGWALSHHLMQYAKADPDARLVLSNESIQYGVEILQAIQNESKSLKKSLKIQHLETRFESEKQTLESRFESEKQTMESRFEAEKQTMVALVASEREEREKSQRQMQEGFKKEMEEFMKNFRPPL
ncbi:hypothetical protein L1987_18998 [Smallanthus sonchifolius]|uniref:Uncharacterized protein n=1 Tax=Smallanthus sonchifolius TaxID=185202 RepID=A0ACB9J3H2_9ASTR|nr:hypothetical protein L1987_18998 [Smallanthus sonchifolius]